MFDFRDVLDAGGLVARRRPNYERREAQLEMAAEVEAAIRERRHLAVEAGTGVGKSFAYLVPAILYAVQDQVREYSGEPFPEDGRPAAPEPPASDVAKAWSDPIAESAEDFLVGGTSNALETRRAVISTHTISLQEQLFEKDVPFLNSILPFEFTAVLAKGRGNYVCLRRFFAAKKRASDGSLFETDKQHEFARLSDWLKSSADGSLSDLDPGPTAEVWQEICCEPGNCLGRSCKENEGCFYAKARRRLEHAQIIIVNHALLFSDLALRQSGGSILPRYDALIFDEAHTMETVAAEHLGVELSQSVLDYLLERLYNSRTNRGMLQEELRESATNSQAALFRRCEEIVEDCLFRSEEFFADLGKWLAERPDSAGRVREPGIVKNGLSEGLQRLAGALKDAAETIEDPSRRQEYRASALKVEAMASIVVDWLEQRGDEFAYWLEKREFGRARGGVRQTKIVAKAAPIDVAPILRKALFNVVPTVIATSATLAAGVESPTAGRRELEAGDPGESEETRRAFAFFRSRVGLTSVRSRALGSPFDYRRQMTLVLAEGLELSAAAGEARGLDKDALAAENERRLHLALRDYVAETDGGVFVLFTNARQMSRATTALQGWFAEKSHPFFSQAENIQRQTMVNKFKNSTRSVLFGVDSFWQGVDVPGAALRNVIIVKLPFRPPTQP
ncbi:MAG: hypothetical protein HUK22_03595, partial [Thermoguttaceae bacterium]|nr:hypothetical protein [Thermoguttaceae bacterium]